MYKSNILPNSSRLYVEIAKYFHFHTFGIQLKSMQTFVFGRKWKQILRRKRVVPSTQLLQKKWVVPSTPLLRKKVKQFPPKIYYWYRRIYFMGFILLCTQLCLLKFVPRVCCHLCDLKVIVIKILIIFYR